MKKKTSKYAFIFGLFLVGFLVGFFLGRQQKKIVIQDNSSHAFPFTQESEINEQFVLSAISPAQEQCRFRYYSTNPALAGSYCIGIDFSQLTVSVTEADEDNYNITFQLPALTVLSSENADLIPEQEALLQNPDFQADTKSRIETILRLFTEDFLGRSNSTITFVWAD